MAPLDEYHALRRTAGVVDRSTRGRLLLTGADRRAYLQGLLSNDIVALGPGSGCYSTYLTPQGRMIADMRVFEIGDSLLVDLDGTITQAVADRWSRFIFSEDVQVQNVSPTTAQIGIYGPHAAEVLEAALASGRTPGEQSPDAELLRSLPVFATRRWDFRGVPAHVVVSDDIGVMGFDLVLPLNLSADIVSLLHETGAAASGALAAETCRVEGGRPLFHVDMDEETIPLEAGIEDRAISLTKGCYVGQEVIIRVLHRGHGRVARKLVGIEMDPTGPLPSRGDRIVAATRDVGTITSAVLSPARGRPIALGYVHRDFAQPGTALEVGGSTAVVTALPFVPITPLASPEATPPGR
jgi:folate-binding protein YgfZ